MEILIIALVALAIVAYLAIGVLQGMFVAFVGYTIFKPRASNFECWFLVVVVALTWPFWLIKTMIHNKLAKAK